MQRIISDFSLRELISDENDASLADLKWSQFQDAIAHFLFGNPGKKSIQFKKKTNASVSKEELLIEFLHSQDLKIFKAKSCVLFLNSSIAKENIEVEEKERTKTYSLHFKSDNSLHEFASVFQSWKGEKNRNPETSEKQNAFDQKIESFSAKMYFHYYGQLLHQQNMLQDYVRTGTYYAAVIENKIDFENKIVVDVGAGSGILSLFAAQAGAKHVYAIEASPMAEYAKKLVEGNEGMRGRITVIHGKVEEVEVPFKADVLISEPMGTLLINERMLESYIIARDRFLKPNGKMFPTLGRIHLAPFSDEYLFVEIANKSLFWLQQGYYGVNLTPLHSEAFSGFFNQPVVDAFDPRLLVSPSSSYTIDFRSSKEEELFEIDVPLSFDCSVSARVHGIACWFDVLFDGSTHKRWLTTAPGAPTTHWYQLRCVLTQPLYVFAGQKITGRMHMVAHSAQSYNLHLTITASSFSDNGIPNGVVQTASGKFDLKEPYYRMSQSPVYSNSTQEQEQEQQQQTQQTVPPVMNDQLNNQFQWDGQ